MIEIIISNSTLIDSTFISKTLLRERKFNFNPSVCDVQLIENELAKTKYDVVLLLPMSPHSLVIETISEIKKIAQTPKILIVSENTQDDFIKLLQSKGVEGVIKTTSLKEQLIGAIHDILDGKYFWDSTIVTNIIREPMDISKEIITDREKEIIGFVAAGLTSKEIASKLYISEHTVKAHRKNINNKLNVHNPAQLVKYAIENNL